MPAGLVGWDTHLGTPTEPLGDMEVLLEVFPGRWNSGAEASEQRPRRQCGDLTSIQGHGKTQGRGGGRPLVLNARVPWGHGQRSPRGLQRRVLQSSCLLHTPGEPSVQAAAGQREQVGVSLHNLTRAPSHTWEVACSGRVLCCLATLASSLSREICVWWPGWWAVVGVLIII